MGADGLAWRNLAAAGLVVVPGGRLRVRHGAPLFSPDQSGAAPGKRGAAVCGRDAPGRAGPEKRRGRLALRAAPDSCRSRGLDLGKKGRPEHLLLPPGAGGLPALREEAGRRPLRRQPDHVLAGAHGQADAGHPAAAAAPARLLAARALSAGRRRGFFAETAEFDRRQSRDREDPVPDPELSFVGDHLHGPAPGGGRGGCCAIPSPVQDFQRRPVLLQLSPQVHLALRSGDGLPHADGDLVAGWVVRPGRLRSDDGIDAGREKEGTAPVCRVVLVRRRPCPRHPAGTDRNARPGRPVRLHSLRGAVRGAGLAGRPAAEKGMAAGRSVGSGGHGDPFRDGHPPPDHVLERYPRPVRAGARRRARELDRAQQPRGVSGAQRRRGGSGAPLRGGPEDPPRLSGCTGESRESPAVSGGRWLALNHRQPVNPGSAIPRPAASVPPAKESQPPPGQAGEVPQQAGVDARGVPDRAEVAGAVAVDVDGPDLDADDGDPPLPAEKEHVEFELVPAAPDPEDGVEQPQRDAAQPGLRVREAQAGREVEDRLRHRVAHARAQRDVAAEPPLSQDQRVLLALQERSHLEEVLDRVLAVGVHRHRPDRVRGAPEDVPQTCLDGLPLAPVALMAEHRHALQPFEHPEMDGALGRAPVIDNHHRAGARRRDRSDDRRQAGVRLERGYDDHVAVGRGHCVSDLCRTCRQPAFASCSPCSRDASSASSAQLPAPGITLRSFAASAGSISCRVRQAASASASRPRLTREIPRLNWACA